MLNIKITTVPHAQQRYDTVGDWILHEDGTIEIRVSDVGNWSMEACVALHELVECLLCLNRGIETETVDSFDMGWKPHDGIDEPGDDPNAPYYEEHQIATAVERLMAAELEVAWVEYEHTLVSQ